MVKLLKAEFVIFCASKTQAGGEAQRTQLVNDIQTKISSLLGTKDNIFLKPKDDRTLWRAGCFVWRLVTGELKSDSGSSQDELEAFT